MEPKETAQVSNGKPKEPQVIQIDLDEFVRLKDAYIAGLATIEAAAHDLSRNFVRHTNELIGKGNISALDLLNLANPLAENGAPPARRAATPGPKIDGIKKPKRPHDKNAPTKAMTPFFLFMQTMRPIIQREMGPEYKSKDVELEGQHRWKNISKPEKDAVQYKYACNRAAYYEKMKAYKAGLPIPEISEEQAEKLYEEQQRAGFVPKPISATLAPTEAVHRSDESSDTSDEDDEKSPTPTKAPSPPKSPRASKRRKTTKDAAEHLAPAKAPHKEVEKHKHTTEAAAPERAAKPVEKKKEKKEKVQKRKEDKENAASAQVPQPGVAAAESSQSKSTPISQDAPKKEKKSRKKRKNDEVDA